jgi:putative ABC transport system permease protein
MGLFMARLLRDLRARKLQVFILMFILGLGGSAWFGLLNSLEWRRQAFDEFNSDYNLDDGVLTIGNEYGWDQGEIKKIMSDYPKLDQLEAVNYRFRYSLSYEFNGTRGFTVLRGYLYGYDLGSITEAPVDGFTLIEGNLLDNSHIGSDVILLDDNFRNEHGLELNDQINLRLKDEIHDVNLVGTIRSPEWVFLIDPESTALTLMSSFGIGYALLPSLQSWLGIGDNINQIVFKVNPSLDPDIVGEDLQGYFDSKGITVSYKSRESYPAHSMIQNDMDGDEETFKSFAIIVYIVAIFSLWISINRLVIHQRREIGIDLSLGTSRKKILLYYLSYGLLIGLGGGILSIIFGYWMGNALGDLAWDILNIPKPQTEINWNLAIQSVIFSLFCSLISAWWPAWKSSRMVPIQALRQDPALAATNKSISSLIGLLLAPVLKISINARIGLRNVLRNRRRTFATILGFGLAISLIIFILGTMSTFNGTIDDYTNEQGQWDVKTTFYSPVPFSMTNQITQDDRVENYYFGLSYFAKIHGSDDSDVIQLMSFSNYDFIPLKLHSNFEENSVVISKKLANELSISQTDTINVDHLVFGSTGYSLQRTSLKVTNLHSRASKLEAFVPWDSLQNLMNVSGSANQLYLSVANEKINSVRAELYKLPYVKLVEVHEDIKSDIEEAMEQFMGAFYAFYVICFLIAFAVILLTSLITHSERTRETGTIATLGASDRMILKISFWEASFMAVVSILIGYGLGYLILGSVLIPMIEDKYSTLVFEPKIIYSEWISVGIVAWLIAMISQLPLLKSLRKMDLSQATKVRDF